MLKKRLSYKISFFVFIILTIIFAVLGMLFYSTLRKESYQNVMDRTTLQSQMIAHEVSHIFESAQLYTYQMSLNPNIQTYLKEVRTREDVLSHSYYEAVYEYLTVIKDSNPLHFLAWVANEQANFYLDSSNVIPDDDYDVKIRPWYDIAISSEYPVFTDPYVEWGSGSIVLSSIYALRESNAIYGFVVIDIMLEDLPDLLNQARIHSKDKIFLISQNGDFLYHYDESFILNENIYKPNNPFYSSLDLIYKEQDTLHSIEYKDQSYFLMSYEIPEANWMIISLIDSKSIHQEMNQFVFRILGITLLGFVLALSGILLFVDRHTQPYKMLVKYATQIEKGETDKDIPKHYLNQADEMGEICRSFQRVINGFRKERASLTQEIEQQYKHIYEVEKSVSLGHMVAGVAHEINTPLGIGITLASHMDDLYKKQMKKLEEGSMTKNDLLDYFHSTEQTIPLLMHNLDRAAKLVKSFKKVAVDQYSEEIQDCNIQEILDSVILSLRSEYKRKNIEIQVDCSEDLLVKGEPGVYIQIFTNLIMNAIHHGFKDLNSGLITIVCRRSDNQILIEFKDNGLGIPEALKDKIFEPFFTTNRSRGNSGLGMSIINQLITHNLKGKLLLETKENEYTLFKMIVPANQQEHTD